ncbi:hypothetical protein Q9L58_007702 [Maublancomyces gigas]|uniref:Uncharacterized protein n=1 Tax=Discina gigas TaxID=1032678 RepID=A0ABR3GBT4_9PEZI
MPPVMHPKSFSTAGLFTTTAVLSFLVVAAPHILPCPATGSERAESTTPIAHLQEKQRKKKQKYLIPRPVPGGLIGEVLGRKVMANPAAKEMEAFWGKRVVFEKRMG